MEKSPTSEATLVTAPHKEIPKEGRANSAKPVGSMWGARSDPAPAETKPQESGTGPAAASKPANAGKKQGPAAGKAAPARADGTKISWASDAEQAGASTSGRAESEQTGKSTGTQRARRGANAPGTPRPKSSKEKVAFTNEQNQKIGSVVGAFAALTPQERGAALPLMVRMLGREMVARDGEYERRTSNASAGTSGKKTTSATAPSAPTEKSRRRGWEDPAISDCVFARKLAKMTRSERASEDGVEFNRVLSACLAAFRRSGLPAKEFLDGTKQLEEALWDCQDGYGPAGFLAELSRAFPMKGRASADEADPEA